MEDQFEEVKDGALFKWEQPGAHVRGVLENYKSQNTAMGEGNVYNVKTKDGIVAFFAPMLLHQKLQSIAIGMVVDITYEKVTKTASGTTLKHFKVGFAKPTEALLKSIGLDMFNQVEDDDLHIDV